MSGKVNVRWTFTASSRRVTPPGGGSAKRWGLGISYYCQSGWQEYGMSVKRAKARTKNELTINREKRTKGAKARTKNELTII